MKDKSGALLVPAAIIELVRVFILIIIGAFIFSAFYSGLQSPEQRAKVSAINLAETIDNIKTGREFCDPVKLSLVDGHGLLVDSAENKVKVTLCESPPCTGTQKIGSDVCGNCEIDYEGTKLAGRTISKVCMWNNDLALDVDTPYCNNDLWLNSRGQQKIVQDFCVCWGPVLSEPFSSTPKVFIFPQGRLKTCSKIFTLVENLISDPVFS